MVKLSSSRNALYSGNCLKVMVMIYNIIYNLV